MGTLSFREENRGPQSMGAPFSNGSVNSACRNRQFGDDLLLKVARVVAVLVGTYRRRVVDRAAGGVAEVVADEGGIGRADAEPQRRVQLWVPGIKAQPDVASLRRKLRREELDARVDAVVRGAIGRQHPREVHVCLVERQPSRGGLRRSRSRAREAPVVKVDADSAVG